MKHIFLINKKAGLYSAEMINKLNYICRDLDIEFQIIETDSLDQMRSYTNYYKRRNVIVYAVGGDGTLSVVLNDLIGGNASLGVIPIGSGNDFYHRLDEYKNEVVTTNVMKVNNQYGINVFSLGIDAEICANTEKMKKIGMPTSLIYKASLLYTLSKHKNQVIGINNYFEKMLLLAICNGTYYGGGFPISPLADIRSEDVRIYLVDDMKKLVLPLFLIDMLLKRLESNSHVKTYLSDEEIRIEGMNPVIGQLDGEIMEEQFYKIKPNAARINVVNNRRLIRELNK